MSLQLLFIAAAIISTHASSNQPNIVFILTDDQDVELFSLDYMPKLKSLISEQGVMFSRMYAAVPVCCPSRSALWSGRYQHNNGVKGNSIAANCSSKEWVLFFLLDALACFTATVFTLSCRLC